MSIPMLHQTGIPQGSVLGPILFTSFISPVHCIATQFRVHQQQYADDIQLYVQISSDPSDPDLTNLESTLLLLSSWFLHNGLALNPEKSEAILLGTHARNRTISKSQVNVAGASIPLSTTLKLFGFHLDNNLNFSKHVNSVSKSSHFHLRALRHTTTTLDLNAAKLIGHATIDHVPTHDCRLSVGNRGSRRVGSTFRRFGSGQRKVNNSALYGVLAVRLSPFNPYPSKFLIILINCAGSDQKGDNRDRSPSLLGERINSLVRQTESEAWLEGAKCPSIQSEAYTEWAKRSNNREQNPNRGRSPR